MNRLNRNLGLCLFVSFALITTGSRIGFCFGCCSSNGLGLSTFEETICKFGCSFEDGSLLVDPNQCFSFPDECTIGRVFYNYSFGEYKNETYFCSEGGIVDSSFAPTTFETPSPSLASTPVPTTNPTRSEALGSSPNAFSSTEMAVISSGVTVAFLAVLFASFTYARKRYASRYGYDSAPPRPKSIKYVPAPQLLNRSAINPGSPVIDTRRYKSTGRQKKHFIVKWDFIAEHEDELTVDVGDRVVGIEKVQEEWWIVLEPVSGDKGLVPTTYIEEINTGPFGVPAPQSNPLFNSPRPPKPSMDPVSQNASFPDSLQLKEDFGNEEDASDPFPEAFTAFPLDPVGDESDYDNVDIHSII